MARLALSNSSLGHRTVREPKIQIVHPGEGASLAAVNGNKTRGAARHQVASGNINLL